MVGILSAARTKQLKLLIGRLSLLNNQLLEADEWLSKALNSLQEAGNQDHLPRAYLAYATLYRHAQNFELAHTHLQDMFNIANSSGMRLHLTDYHLEMAQLLVGEAKFEEAREQVAKAAKLIRETGYKRRLPELEALQQLA